MRLLASTKVYRGHFRFDKRLLNKPRVKETIVVAWNFSQSRQLASVSERLRSCRKALSKWKKSNATNSLERIDSLKKELEEEQASDLPRLHVVNSLKYQLGTAYKEEESYWSQKSNENWLKEGDMNSKFFHASVKSARKKKILEKLLDEKGNIQKAEASKGEVATAYFSSLFKSTNPSDFQDIFSGFAPRVSAQMNENLTKEVSVEEIKEAVFAIKPSSAPGPDGMSGLFFRNTEVSLVNR